MADVLTHIDTLDVEVAPQEELDVTVGSPMEHSRVLSITKNGKHVVSEYDLAEVDVQPLPKQDKVVEISKNGEYTIEADEGRQLNSVVAKVDTTEQCLVDFINNGGRFYYYQGEEMPDLDWSKVTTTNLSYMTRETKATCVKVQKMLDILSDEKNCKGFAYIYFQDPIGSNLFLKFPKGFKNSKKQDVLSFCTFNKNINLTIDCNDLEYTGTLLGWSGGFRLKLLNTSKLKEFYNPSSNIELEAFDCSSLIKTPYNGVHNQTTYIGGFIDLGKGFLQNDTASNHLMWFDNYMQNLTKESLLNIFNGLYDLNLLGFTFVNQPTFKMGDKNFAKVTEEDIKIATDKGWIVTQ